eukprot:m.45661 g.45661  ORF g.45661 m.45661 type:complete len:51 (-) comp15141_c0_seq4:81-233(-)
MRLTDRHVIHKGKNVELYDSVYVSAAADTCTHHTHKWYRLRCTVELLEAR